MLGGWGGRGGGLGLLLTARKAPGRFLGVGGGGEGGGGGVGGGAAGRVRGRHPGGRRGAPCNPPPGGAVGGGRRPPRGGRGPRRWLVRCRRSARRSRAGPDYRAVRHAAAMGRRRRPHWT